jgi:muramoyltetrapeptide carboxypeptidase
VSSYGDVPNLLRPGLRPPPLRVGARLGLVAPAGPISEGDVASGLRPYLAAGFEVTRWRAGFDAEADAEAVAEANAGASRDAGASAYLSGGDAARLGELVQALRDPTIEGVVCARGGYGTQRLLSALWQALSAQPPPLKLVVGFSDITALHSFCYFKLGWATLHGPMPKSWATPAPNDPLTQAQAASWGWLHEALTSPASQRLPCALASAGPHGATARGVLLGGNLTLVDALYRSPWMPHLRGALLLLEDVAEAPYRLDRMLTSLEGRGAAAEVAGVVLGAFTDCGGLSPDVATDGVARLLRGWGVPIYRDLCVGHMHPQRACWLGRMATLDPAHGLTIDLADEGAPDVA